jgi:hypothetical protein
LKHSIQCRLVSAELSEQCINGTYLIDINETLFELAPTIDDEMCSGTGNCTFDYASISGPYKEYCIGTLNGTIYEMNFLDICNTDTNATFVQQILNDPYCYSKACSDAEVLEIIESIGIEVVPNCTSTYNISNIDMGDSSQNNTNSTDMGDSSQNNINSTDMGDSSLKNTELSEQCINGTNLILDNETLDELTPIFDDTMCNGTGTCTFDYAPISGPYEEYCIGTLNATIYKINSLDNCSMATDSPYVQQLLNNPYCLGKACSDAEIIEIFEKNIGLAMTHCQTARFHTI